MVKLILICINWYQRYISIFLPPVCRYQPTCSEYAKHAFMKHGIWHGGWMAMKRILRCNPFFPGGIDRV